MKRYLVTGGAGFIGSNLTEYLLKAGHFVRVLDNFANGKRENLSFVAEIPGAQERFELIEGDIRDYETCLRACEGMDFVLHQAALGSVPRSVEDPETYHQVNTTGTLNMLRAAAACGVKRLVYAASSSAYGDVDREKPTPKREDMPPAPLSPYAVAKLTGEYYCQIFPKLYGLETVILRYFNVFGPRQDPHSQYAAVVPKFITSLLQGEPPTIFGDGEQSRDFTYVENVVHANLAACEAGSEAVGEVINVACGENTTINALYRLIAELIGTDLEPRYAPPRPGDVRHSLADVSKAQRLLGLREVVDLREGLQRTISWYREQMER